MILVRLNALGETEENLSDNSHFCRKHIESTQLIYFMSVGSMWVWVNVLTNCTLSFEGNLLEPQWKI